MNAINTSKDKMSIYITRNGQHFGPYSIPEAHNMLRAGNLTLTDYAWHEGLPQWVPLSQISGFTVTPPVPPVPAPAEISNPAHPFSTAPKPNQNIFQKMGGAIVGVIVLLFKFKFLLFGGLKTGLSMLLMIWVYSTIWGWKFAAGFVFLIFVHEMGHVIAAKWLGMPVSAPLFIPFIGASIIMKESPRDAWTEALMAYGGPFAGCVGSWICWGLAIYLHQPWIMAVASLSFLINLFNMIPVPPLDGGRICAAVSPWFWIIGLVLLGMAVFYFHAWNSIVIIILVLIVALPRMKETLFGEPSEEMQRYYSVHISNRLTMALLYLGLIAALLLGYWDAANHLTAYQPSDN